MVDGESMPQLPVHVAPPKSDASDGESYALLCASRSSVLAMVGSGLAQMGTPSVAVRTSLDAMTQLDRDDISFGTVFVFSKDNEFPKREFLPFLAERYPAVGRLVVTVNEKSFDTSVWVEPADHSQTWSDSAGLVKADWRIRFSRGIGRRTDVTLI